MRQIAWKRMEEALWILWCYFLGVVVGVVVVKHHSSWMYDIIFVVGFVNVLIFIFIKKFYQI